MSTVKTRPLHHPRLITAYQRYVYPFRPLHQWNMLCYHLVETKFLAHCHMTCRWRGVFEWIRMIISSQHEPTTDILVTSPILVNTTWVEYNGGNSSSLKCIKRRVKFLQFEARLKPYKCFFSIISILLHISTTTESK